MNSRLADVINAIFDSLEHASGKLNISMSKLMLYIQKNKVPAWMMRILIDRWKVNPLYIFGDSTKMFLK